MSDDVWILGATGRTGQAVAARLHRAGVSLVLVGRDRARLERLKAELDGGARLVVGPLQTTLTELTRDAPAVVVNTVGPFTTTGPQVLQACPPRTRYVDIANELGAVEQVLERDRETAASGQVVVTGAGFGVLATESVVLRLCAGQPPVARVRVDALASVATEPGVLGVALAGTIVEVLVTGGRQVRGGRLVRSRLAAEPAQLTTPDGERLGTSSGPSGELLAAWRASGADTVVAASSASPTSAAVRWALPVAAAVMRLPGVQRLAVRTLARMALQAKDRPRPSSWAHARVEWPSGAVREGWLRAGDGMTFTAAVAAEVAVRLLRGEGQPGCHTPGALFGPDLAVAVGAEFVDLDAELPTVLPGPELG